MENKINFFRCKDCLGVWTLELPMQSYFRGFTRPESMPSECPYCQSNEWEWLGFAQLDSMVKPESYCPCDDRCTHAMGPKCDCKCCGANHGIGSLWTIKRVGNTSVYESKGEFAKRQIEKYKIQALQYKCLYNECLCLVHEKFGNLFKAYKNREWIQNFNDYLKGKNFLTEVQKTKELKTHNSRMKKLEKVLKNFNIITV